MKVPPTKLKEAAQDERLLTETEVADFFKVTKRKLQNDRLKRLGLPYLKYGANVRYKWSDIQAHISAHTISHPTLRN